MSETLLRKFGDYTVISVPHQGFRYRGETYTCFVQYKDEKIENRSGFRNEAGALTWAATAIADHKRALVMLEDAASKEG